MTAWSSDQFYAKAKSLIERGLDSVDDPTARAWWFHFALEPLLKAVVANRHPVLLADPRSFDSLLVSIGEAPLKAPAMNSRTMADLVKNILPALISEDRWSSETGLRAQALLDRRNNACHGPDAAFENLDQDLWLPDFLRVALPLCEALGEELADLVGPELADHARDIVAEDEKRVLHDVTVLIDEARARFGDLIPVQASYQMIVGEADVRRAQLCPACGSGGTLRGRVAHIGPVRIDEVDGLVRSATIACTDFRCPQCSLHLLGHARLRAAKLPATFEAIVEELDAYQLLRLDPAEELQRQGLFVVDPEDYNGYEDE